MVLSLEHQQRLADYVCTQTHVKEEKSEVCKQVRSLNEELKPIKVQLIDFLKQRQVSAVRAGLDSTDGKPLYLRLTSVTSVKSIKEASVDEVLNSLTLAEFNSTREMMRHTKKLAAQANNFREVVFQAIERSVREVHSTESSNVVLTAVKPRSVDTNPLPADITRAIDRFQFLQDSIQTLNQSRNELNAEFKEATSEHDQELCKILVQSNPPALHASVVGDKCKINIPDEGAFAVRAKEAVVKKPVTITVFKTVLRDVRCDIEETPPERPDVWFQTRWPSIRDVLQNELAGLLQQWKLEHTDTEQRLSFQRVKVR